MAALSVPPARAICTISLVSPALQVTMVGLRPIVHAQVNGKDAQFIADSGAFFSSVTRGAVEAYGLRTDNSAGTLRVVGAGGVEVAEIARAKQLRLFDHDFPDVPFLVVGNALGDNIIGLLGQNILRISDIEYDLANGVIRLVAIKDCDKAPLAYWTRGTDVVASSMDIEFATRQFPHTRGVAYLNGTKIKVMFDTGAAQSLLTLEAAKRAGITPTSPGVESGGTSYGGIGRHSFATWIARFKSFKVGDEEVQNALLRFGNASANLLDADMLIGADFFLSHRVLVASSQRRLYFSYNGGPVFDLRSLPSAEASAGQASAPSPPTASKPPGDGQDTAASAPDGAPAPLTTAPSAPEVSDQPHDAAAFARRGAAATARHDYAAAVSDLTRAVTLSPEVAEYYYQRGIAYWWRHERDQALADFDRAITLRSDYFEARIARADLNVSRHADAALVDADLEAAARNVPMNGELRLAHAYEHAGEFNAAIAEYGKWIGMHENEAALPNVLNARCWSRALWGEELAQALLDCNAALKARPGEASFLDSRGLVYLRQGNYKSAIADYDAALKQRPEVPWSLYGRGIARTRSGDVAGGEADMAAAKAVDKDIAEEAKRYGVTP